MNLLRKILLGVALATGVVASMNIEVPQAKADIIFFKGPYATLELCESARFETGSATSFRSQYVTRGPNGPGWYLVRN
jgi:hypothetical protein